MKKYTLLSVLFFTTLYYSQVGTTCQNPIVIASLPYTTTDDTANYADNYDPSTTNPQPTCASTSNGNYYHSGNDVIYSYTATSTGTIKIEIPNAIAWTGMFMYANCADIGVQYAACSTSTTSGPRTINNFPVTIGQTYYILISSWTTPQTVAYTLNVTQLSLSTNEVEVAKREIAIYPNPTSKSLSFKTNKKIVGATIYTMEGRKIVSKKVEDNNISIEELSKGNYIVEFTDRDGNFYTKTFIKN